jgi:hypothetical protein
MIYARIVSPVEMGEYKHLQEISEDTLNIVDNIHPQYNNLKGDYSIVEINRLVSFIQGNLGTDYPSVKCGIALPFHILKDETLTITYDVIGATPVNAKHCIYLYDRGTLRFSKETAAIDGTNSFEEEIVITGTYIDGYLFVGAIFEYPTSGGLNMNNLIIT